MEKAEKMEKAKGTVEQILKEKNMAPTFEGVKQAYLSSVNLDAFLNTYPMNEMSVSEIAAMQIYQTIETIEYQ